MNDNVLENLIARQPRPTPSRELDARIAEIMNPARPDQKRSRAAGHASIRHGRLRGVPGFYVGPAIRLHGCDI